jgi:hypothetical protein
MADDAHGRASLPAYLRTGDRPGQRAAGPARSGSRAAALVAQDEYDQQLVTMGLTGMYVTELRRSRQGWTLFLVDKRDIPADAHPRTKQQRRRPAPVTVSQVHPGVHEEALRLAGGDACRLRIHGPRRIEVV